MKCIDDTKIVGIENFVKNELLDLLNERCKQNNIPFNNADKVFFFGCYQSTPEKFKFLPGEIMLINEIAQEVRKVIDRDGNLDFFKMPKQFIISRKDTCQLFGCTFYGKRTHKQILIPQMFDVIVKPESKNTAEAESSKSCPVVLKTHLLSKLKVQFEQRDQGLKEQNYLSESMVEIINDGNRIVAQVQCIFCNKESKTMKTFRIQFDTAKNDKAYWNFSNFARHLDSHFAKTNVDAKETIIAIDDIEEIETVVDKEIIDTEEIEVEEVDVSIVDIDEIQKTCNVKDMGDDKIESDASFVEIDSGDFMIVTASDDEAALNNSGVSEEDIKNYEISEIIDTDSIEYKIFTQISEQNLFLTNAILSHNERVCCMKFNLKGSSTNLDVIRIASDGNCLYACIAHQLFGYKVDSYEHEKVEASLRESCVDFIEQNYEEFSIHIKGRVLEERENKIKIKLKNQLKNKRAKKKSSLLLKHCGEGQESEENEDSKNKPKNKRAKKKSTYVSSKHCADLLTELREGDIFGGSESIKALSTIHSVNILIFNESGIHYFPLGFNSNFKRTIFMAHRFHAKSTVLNHYDSPVEINMVILCDCVSVLSEVVSTKEKLSGSNMLETTLE